MQLLVDRVGQRQFGPWVDLPFLSQTLTLLPHTKSLLLQLHGKTMQCIEDRNAHGKKGATRQSMVIFPSFACLSDLWDCE